MEKENTPIILVFIYILIHLEGTLQAVSEHYAVSGSGFTHTHPALWKKENWIASV